ncbi:MAG: hypothetical protein ACC645_20610 [Pirellulales bacterium]
MNILVCIKQILDPEVPARDFKIDREELQADPACANQVTNIFCENALETALQIKDATGGTVTALAFGKESAVDSLKKALAMKADNACLALNEGPPHPDSAATAKVLAAAIRKLGSFDLILLGREAGDWGAGQTGGLLAGELGLPFLAFVDEIKESENGLTLRRQTETGCEVYEAPRPLLATITNSDHNLPRIPKTRDIILAGRKPVSTWTLNDLDLPEDTLAPESAACKVVDLYIPEQGDECEFIEGENIDEKIENLAGKISEIIRAV